jgi:iron complex transport system substrate-binding protein
MMRKDWKSFFRLHFIGLGLFILIGASLPFFINHRQSTRRSIHTFDNPERIVSLAPDITEILFALGLGNRIIAVTSDSDYPPEAAAKQKVGKFWKPSTEAIISIKPDLVITQWFAEQKALADTLEQLGYNVLVLSMQKFSELPEVINKIGTVTGTQEKAEKLANDIDNKINELKAKYKQNEKIKALWVIDEESLRVAGRETFLNEILEAAGGENAIGKTLQQYPSISTEELISCGAEVIIQSAMSKENLEIQQKHAELFWSKYPNLPAVKHNRIYVLYSDTLLRLGPRLPEGIEIIAGCLYRNVSEK